MSGVRASRWVFVSVIVVAVLRAAPAYPVSGPIYSLAIDPVTPTVLFAGGANGMFKSVDGGAMWSPTLPNWTQSIAIDPVTPTTVYAGTDSGLVQSTDCRTTCR